MSKYIDPAVVKHLSQKKNLAITLEIERYAPTVKTELLFGFWSKLIAALKAARPTSLPAEEFAFKIKDKSIFMEDVYEIASTPPYTSDQRPTLLFMIGQYHSDEEFSFYEGVAWTAEIPNKSRLYERKEVKSLRASMIDDGYFVEEWWVGWRYLQTFSSLEQFLLRSLETPKEIIDSFVGPFWQTVSKYRNCVNAANRALSRSKRQY